MKFWEINKIAGALLGSLAFVLGLSVVSNLLFTETPPAEPGYRVDIPDETDTQTAEAPTEVPFAVLLANADAAAGERDARVCAACHSFEEGGPTKVGPNLYNIVGNKVLHVADYSYSSALTEWGADKTWSYENLDHFLEHPAGLVPGTSMAYAGIKDDESRADVIMYLRSISPDAPPLPEPPAETDVAAADPAATTGTATDAAGGTGEAGGGGDVTAFAALVAAADPAAGERNARLCAACHSFEEGGPTKVGPNLYNIVGNSVPHVADYNYSNALKGYAETHPTWTIANLDAYLEDPMGLVPGTRMAYAGIKDEQERAEVIAYLVSISPDAPPITPAAAPATAAAGDAAGTATDAAPAAGDGAASPATDPTATPPTDTAPADATPAAPDQSGDAAPAQPAPTDDSAAAPADGSAAGNTTETAAADPAPADAAASDGTDTAGSDINVAAAAPAETTGDAAAAPSGDTGGLAAFVQLVKDADPASAPASVTAVCQACHSVNEGGPTLVGPNLWDIVGNKVLHVPDFAYSDAFKTYAEQHPTWTIAELDAYLTDPMTYIPGTRMAFAGVKDENERAAVISWLRSHSANPVSLDDPAIVGTAN